MLRLNTANVTLMLTRGRKKSVVICFTWMACASVHHVQATLSVLPLFLFCLAVRVCAYGSVYGGLASGRWRTVGVFMVYFWPQQQKHC